jgi:hypothetical protein
MILYLKYKNRIFFYYFCKLLKKEMVEEYFNFGSRDLKDEHGNIITRISLVENFTPYWVKIVRNLIVSKYAVKNIFRVNNTNQQKIYDGQKEIDIRNKINEQDSYIGEKILYHVSRNNETDSGFDVRTAKVGLFGRGIYFSENLHKCNTYRVRSSKYTILYVADVNLGRIKIFSNKTCNRALYKAPITFDSVKGNPSSIPYHDEYVVYESSRTHIHTKILYTNISDLQFTEYCKLIDQGESLYNHIQDLKKGEFTTPETDQLKLTTHIFELETELLKITISINKLITEEPVSNQPQLQQLYQPIKVVIEKKYKCEICSKAYCRFGDVFKHKQKCHVPSIILECKFCKFTTTKQELYDKHLASLTHKNMKDWIEFRQWKQSNETGETV